MHHASLARVCMPPVDSIPLTGSRSQRFLHFLPLQNLQFIFSHKINCAIISCCFICVQLFGVR